MNDELFIFKYLVQAGGIIAIPYGHKEIFAVAALPYQCWDDHDEQFKAFKNWCENTYDESDFLTGLEVGCRPGKWKPMEKTQ
jgi:hypothetical protein